MATPKIKTYGEGRICEGADCTTRLSRSNPDELCSSCHKKVRLQDLPTRMAQFL